MTLTSWNSDLIRQPYCLLPISFEFKLITREPSEVRKNTVEKIEWADADEPFQ